MDLPKIKNMTLREKIAQLLIVRMSDLIQDASTSYTKMRAPEEAAQLMEKYQFGGIWLHGALDVNGVNDEWKKNVKFTVDELKKWYEETRKNVRIPVIAACDAIADTASELSNYPKGLAIGASSDPDAAFKLGQCIAREMSCCGIDWIWSPVADYCNRRHCFITRQFSNIPDDLIKCAIGYMKGLQSINVAATVKHFPGADKYDMRDSHIVTTNIGMTLEEWWEEQGRIFQEVIDAGVDAVMTEASAFPAVDDTCINGRFIPAGLSHRVITELLK